MSTERADPPVTAPDMTDTADAEAGRVHFPCFNGYRALAAVAVLVLHVSFISGVDSNHHDLGQYLIRLDVGVSVFFLISGFLLYRPFVLAHLRGKPGPGLRDYFAGRFLRIYPAYWVALIAVVWVFHQSGATHRIHNLGDFVSYFGLLQQYTASHQYGGIQQAWTLCVEVAFYVFLPLWAVAMRRVARRATSVVPVELAGLVVLFATGIAYRMIVLTLNPGGSNEISWMPAFLDQFALGMLLAVVSAGHETKRLRSRLADTAGEHPWVCWAIAAACFWTVSTRFGLPIGYRHLSRGEWLAWTLGYGATAFFVLLPGIFGNQDQGVIRRFLRHPVVAGVGVLSFGIYLWHELFLDRFFHSTGILSPGGNAFAIFGYAGGLSLVAAALSWKFVERPAMGLRSRVVGWGRGKRPRAS